MCEYSGVNSVAALREARKKKILENSANRLKLIEGINSSVEKQTVEKFQEPIPKPEIKTSEFLSNNTESLKPKINPKLNEIINESKELKEISDFILRASKNVVEGGEEETEEVAFDRNRVKTFSEILLQKKLHYILLAVVVNIMLLYNVGHLFYDNIFCPFYTVKLVEVLSRREMEQLQPIFQLFIATLPKKLQKLTKVAFFLFSILLSDLCLYLFTFIIGNKLAALLG